ncbi:MAG: nitroreductase [Gammaproteobacteria bacterium]|nr:nitroreductase [Gammaproteobacteria bacterium]
MTALEQVYVYHERTKHRLDRYAAGPPTLDWDHQPDPFRRFTGCEIVALPLSADSMDMSWQDLFAKPPASQPVTLRNIGVWLELSLGLAAWKNYGAARWALRCNPSSGNLHPTEGYLICAGLDDLANGIYHYAPEIHTLEQRCRFEITGRALYLGLSGVIWREAWKYGERAFRYVQLDSGHALGALSYAAALLGWRLEVVPASDAQLMSLLGLNRRADFQGAEVESPDLLLRVVTKDKPIALNHLLEACQQGVWQGEANHLGGEPHFDWPAINAVAAATHTEQALPAPVAAGDLPPALTTDCAIPVATLIRTRRSAQAFDGSTTLARSAFYRILDATLPRSDQTPWTTWPYAARIHLILFVHRVEGLAPGLYALPRYPSAEKRMRQAMSSQFDWSVPEGCPSALPLRHLVSANAQKVARTLSCHQDIASHSCFSVAMLSEFDTTLALHPAEYRRLYWEAGLIGQVLYLEAEAAGVRGTGIGCFFDDSVHQLLELQGTVWQSLYHFTVGGTLTDTRIQTQPPYGNRKFEQ